MSSAAFKSIAVVKAINEEECTYYQVDVTVEDCTWHLLKRFKDFESLNEQLVKKRGLTRGLLPPKIVINSRSAANVEKRRQLLHEYMRGVVAFYKQIPREFLVFVEFEEHDVVGVSQKMAKAALTKGDRLLEMGKLVEFTPLQLHCVTRRLTTAAPTFGYDDSDDLDPCDLGHLFDFLYQLKRVKICSQSDTSGSSGETSLSPKDNVIVGSRAGFPFDVSVFKAVEDLVLIKVDPALIRGLESIQPRLQKLAVHQLSDPIEAILITGDLWSISTSSSSSLSDIRHRAQPWPKLTFADFRNNKIKYLPPAFKLLVKVEKLDLSENEITEIQNLDLINLTKLDLSFNQITSLADADKKLGNISVLNVSNNRLKSLEGIGRLYSLAILDATDNCIEKIRDVSSLSKLPCLQEVDVEGNPLTASKHYREMVVGLLHEDVIAEPRFLLDGKPISKRDLVDSEKYRNWTATAVATAPNSGDKSQLQSVTSKRRGKRLIRLVSEEGGGTQPSPLLRVRSDDDDDDFTDGERGRFEKTPSFRDQVESLRSEGGKQWLSLYNERASTETMTTTSDKREKSPSRKRRSKKSPEKTESSSVDSSETTKKDDVIAPSQDESFSAIATVFHPAVPWDELTTNEGLKMGGDRRIVTIDVNQFSLMEVDMNTGELDGVFNLDSFQEVVLLRRSDPVVACKYSVSSNHTQYRCYSFEKSAEATTMFAILQRLIKSNSFSLASVTPNVVVPQPEEPAVFVSSTLKDYFSHFVAGRCRQAGLLDDKTEDEEVEEKILSVFETSCLPYAYANSKAEISVYVILTNRCLHLVRKSDGASDWIYGFPLESLRQIVVGLFDQSFRIEAATGSQGTFSLLTRNSNVTHEFITKFQDVVKEENKFLQPSEETTIMLKTSLAKSVFSSEPIETAVENWDLVLYMLLFELDDSDPKACVARTLVVTISDIFLCDEDLVHWPLPTFAFAEPSNPRYVVAKSRRVEDVSGVEILCFSDDESTARGGDIRLLFDGDETWLLRLATESHRQKIVQCLSDLWAENFHRELRIFEGRRHSDDRRNEVDVAVATTTTTTTTASNSLDSLRDMSAQDLAKYIHQSIGGDDLLAVKRRTWTSCILYARPRHLFESCVVLTATSVYVVAKSEDLDVRRRIDNNVSVLQVNVDDIARICVGLFDQCFRVEGDGVATTFACVTRDSAETNEMVSIVRTAATKVGSSDGTGDDIYETENDSSVAVTTDESLADLVALLREYRDDKIVDVPILAYNVVRHDDRLKSIVVTDESVAIFVEDQIQFPPPHFCRTPPTVERFGRIRHWSVRALKRVVFARLGEANRFSLIFTNRPPSPARERLDDGMPKDTLLADDDFIKVDIAQEEEETSSKDEQLEEISIETGSYREREKLLRTLSMQWHAQMMDDLPMEAKSST